MFLEEAQDLNLVRDRKHKRRRTGKRSCFYCFYLSSRKQSYCWQIIQDIIMLFVKSAHQYFQWGSLKVFMFILYKDEYSLLFLDKKMFSYMWNSFLIIQLWRNWTWDLEGCSNIDVEGIEQRKVGRMLEDFKCR